MSSEKNIRIDLRVSIEDKKRLKELADKMECSESYVLRRAVAKLHENVFSNRDKKEVVNA